MRLHVSRVFQLSRWSLLEIRIGSLIQRSGTCLEANAKRWLIGLSSTASLLRTFEKYGEGWKRWHRGAGRRHGNCYERSILAISCRRVVGDYSDPLLDAIDDIGSDEPLRIRASGYTYLRDERVRARVLERARERCEYCGAEGRLKENGTRYLGSHHVIALAHDGEDRETNVIALCANDHRQAHFGATET